MIRNKICRRSFKVHGLDCPEEVSILRESAGARAGVKKLKFDALRGRMTVEFDPDTIDSDRIIDAVASTGMKAVPWDEQEEGENSDFWQSHGHFLMAASSGALLVSGIVSRWLVEGTIWHEPSAAPHVPAEEPLITIFLFLGAIITGAWFVAPKAVISARRLRPDMHLLMMIAVAGAIIIGEWFEAATVAFLFAVALWLERWSVGRARRAIEALLDVSPPVARCLNEADGTTDEKPVAEVELDSYAVVRPGEKIPLDGIITEGSSSVNQAPITGESMPVSKEAGDQVYAGTVNGEGAFTFQVTHRAEDTTLARIIHMVEEAESRRAPAEQWVDKFARWYTPAMILLAILVALVPPLVFAAEWTQWLYRGLVVLVIACPCALVISTPVSIVAGLASAARAGVLIKGGVYLEAAGRIRTLALDKTGTLTYGKPKVQKAVPLNKHSKQELLSIAASLESHSEHPLARAIVECAQQDDIEFTPASDFRALKGKGAEATIAGRRYWIGSSRMMRERELESADIRGRAEELEDAGHSVVVLGTEDHVCGLISLADSLREGAKETLDKLRQAGVSRIIMLTGDNEGTARAVAEAAGVDEYKSALMPDDKVAAVEILVQDDGCVGMVGDGINDAPAMARADFGVAMGTAGTDVAIETGDVALMSDDLSRLPWLINHSRRTLRVIKQNIGFALGLKALFIALALPGLATLWMAIAADTGASLLVIFNGLRLLRGKES